MKVDKGFSNKFFKTDCIFHEEVLGNFEDSIQANPKLTEQQKAYLIDVLYGRFYHVTVSEKESARKNSKLIEAI